jgi:hypothetical protein
MCLHRVGHLPFLCVHVHQLSLFTTTAPLGLRGVVSVGHVHIIEGGLYLCPPLAPCFDSLLCLLDSAGIDSLAAARLLSTQERVVCTSDGMH